MGAIRLVLLLCACACCRSGGVVWPDVPRPPAQPDFGPGGSDYSHSSYDRQAYGTRQGKYWILRPTEPEPNTAPVIAFCHDSAEMHPYRYEAWLVHLVRRGNLVIYPRYQADLRTPSSQFTPSAAGAIKSALLQIDKTSPTKPSLQQFALVGHGTGAAVAANIAARSTQFGLPVPAALLCAQPGQACYAGTQWALPLADLSNIPADTLLLVLVGADDHVADANLAADIMDSAVQVDADNKDLVVVPSDDHGRPTLVADHDFPTGQLGSGYQVNALDFYGVWKLFDGLTDAAFFGKHRDYALGNTPRQCYMGAWSDGKSVKQLQVDTHWLP